VPLIHAGRGTVGDQFGPGPIFGHTVDGTQNGHTAVAEQRALFKKHVRPPERTLFSDRGTLSAGHVLRLHADGFHAVAAAPGAACRPRFDQHHQGLKWPRARYLSREHQRRRPPGERPGEHDDLAVVAHERADRESAPKRRGRVLFVGSTADQKVARKNRPKAVAKLRAGLEQLPKSVTEGRRNPDPTAIARRGAKLFGERQAANYFRYERIPLSTKEPEQLPAPQRGCRRPTHRLVFTCEATAAERDADSDGSRALGSTAPRTQSADVLFRKDQAQNFAAQANHGCTTPLAVPPVFLKSPQRVEALVLVLRIVLMLSSVRQRLYRQTVPAAAPVAAPRTTTQPIRRACAKDRLLIPPSRQGREVPPTRLTSRPRQRRPQLGVDTPAQILSRRLSRGP
jgi:hypothetical protein